MQVPINQDHNLPLEKAQFAAPTWAASAILPFLSPPSPNHKITPGKPLIYKRLSPIGVLLKNVYIT